MTRFYGFYSECQRRYNVALWRLFITMFNHLPIVAIIDDRILCMHGGISPELMSNRLDHINTSKKIQRPVDMPNDGILCDLMWSDPGPKTSGWTKNERGVSYLFGPDVLDKFLAFHDLDLICRAH